MSDLSSIIRREREMAVAAEDAERDQKVVRVFFHDDQQSRFGDIVELTPGVAWRHNPLTLTANWRLIDGDIRMVLLVAMRGQKHVRTLVRGEDLQDFENQEVFAYYGFHISFEQDEDESEKDYTDYSFSFFEEEEGEDYDWYYDEMGGWL